MKRIRFSELFLFVTIVIFFGSGKNIYSSVLLMLASVYMMIDVASELKKRRDDNADRKS
jgi:hypothetical protein